MFVAPVNVYEMDTPLQSNLQKKIIVINNIISIILVNIEKNSSNYNCNRRLYFFFFVTDHVHNIFSFYYIDYVFLFATQIKSQMGSFFQDHQIFKVTYLICLGLVVSNRPE